MASTKKANKPKRIDVDAEHYFDVELADLIIEMFEACCTHCEGDSEMIGKFIKLLPAWKDAIGELLATKRKTDDLRKYLEAFWCLARKNSKTHTVAGLALIMIGPVLKTKDAKGYIFSLTEDQARVLFGICCKMITQKKFYDDGTPVDDDDDILKQNYEVNASYIKCKQTGSELHVLSGNPKGKTGTNPAFIFIDEAHELQDFKAISAIETGVVAQSQPLTIVITTKGDDNPKLPWMKLYEQADKVRKGRPDAREDLHVMIWEAEPGDDISSPLTWAKANPAWGIYLNERVMRSLYNKMKDDPERLREFTKFHCNIATSPVSGYIPRAIWDECIFDYGGPPGSTGNGAALNALLGRDMVAGLDLADSDDMCALGGVFPEWIDTGQVDPQTGQKIIDLYIDVLAWYWCPEKTVIDSAKGDVDYRKWVEDGWIEQTSGSISDYALIRSRIMQRQKEVKILECGFDRYNAVDTVNQLGAETRGRDRLEMVQVIQGAPSLNAPTRRFKDLVYLKRVRHNGNPVLAWNLRNAAVVEKKNLRMLEKTKSSGKIDGLAAIMNALYLVLHMKPKIKSRLAERGITSFG